jgi:hypothetical protein
MPRLADRSAADLEDPLTIAKSLATRSALFVASAKFLEANATDESTPKLAGSKILATLPLLLF